MDYYHDLITDRSWRFAQELRRKYDFVLIGGWAVYLYSKALKSKDIDIIVNLENLGRLKTDFEIFKNERLKKYEMHKGEFDVDIYTAFYSDLGIPAEDIEKTARSLNGFRVPSAEMLLILKQKAFLNRAGSLKGEKDKIDIIALLKSGVDFGKYRQCLKSYKMGVYEKKLRELLNEIREVPEVGLNAHQFSKLKKQWIKPARC